MTLGALKICHERCGIMLLNCSIDNDVKCCSILESVKEACSSKLLQAWLRTFGGNVLELLGALDVEYSTETCELVLNTLFKHSTTSELIKNFDILDEK